MESAVSVFTISKFQFNHWNIAHTDTYCINPSDTPSIIVAFKTRTHHQPQWEFQCTSSSTSPILCTLHSRGWNKIEWHLWSMWLSADSFIQRPQSLVAIRFVPSLIRANAYCSCVASAVMALVVQHIPSNNRHTSVRVCYLFFNIFFQIIFNLLSTNLWMSFSHRNGKNPDPIVR